MFATRALLSLGLLLFVGACPERPGQKKPDPKPAEGADADSKAAAPKAGEAKGESPAKSS